MKKIKTLFEKRYDGKKYLGVVPNVSKGCEWVIDGEGVATIKYDGTCTMIKDGKLYRRYDAKHGKKPPIGAIPCCEPDPITGHWPHWLEVNIENPKGDEKYFIEGINNSFGGNIANAENGTYELCGPKINGNHEKLDNHIFIKHGQDVVDCPRDYEGLKEFLKTHYIEGIVFHRMNAIDDMCKIKRRDFGFKWGIN